MIFDTKMKASNISPRCSSIKGHIDICLSFKIEEKLLGYIDDIIVGF
jgi:hypothetical protein